MFILTFDVSSDQEASEPSFRKTEFFLVPSIQTPNLPQLDGTSQTITLPLVYQLSPSQGFSALPNFYQSTI